MKLFNNNIDFKFIQKIFKLIIILLLVFYCIYILYFSSNLVEGFSANLDCSNCQMKPSSGDCIPIYDFSYSLYNTNLEIDQGGISFESIDTGYVFCPWQANCTRDDYLANMLDQDERGAVDENGNYVYSNEDFLYNKGLNNITCCSGEDFYNNNTNSYNTAYQSLDNSFNFTNKCNDFSKNFLTNLANEFTIQFGFASNLNFTNVANMNYIINTDALSDDNKDKINKLYNNTNFNNIRTYCTNNNSVNLNDFSGMLFKKNSVSQNILLDPDLTIQDIFDYQNRLELSYNTLENGSRVRLETITYNNTTFTIDEINNQLRELTTNPSQIRSTQGYTQLELQTMISKFFVSTISYEDISYIPVNSSTLVPMPNSGDLITNQYLLNEDQFFNCFGDVKDVCANNTGVGSQFQQDIQSDILSGVNYFGVSDETIKTASEITPNNYGPSMDLAMELANLENIQPGGTAPVSVINQYLNAINGFYEKPIQNLIGPRTHSINDQIVFDNNTLDTKTNTFLTYENEPNNTYECTNSITNDNKFEYCGPTPYYSDFKL